MEVNWYYLTRLFILVWGSFDVVRGHDCESDESLACRKEIAAFTKFKQKHKYPSDNYTLNEMCRLQLLVTNCLSSFARTCLAEEEQEILKVMIKGSDKFLDHFCFEDSHLRKTYLKHSKCIRNISSSLEDCSKEYKDAQRILEDQEENIDKFKQRTCCLYFENISCSANATSAMCGEEASDLVRDLWTLLGGTYLNELCDPYSTYEYEQCMPVSKGYRTDARLLTVIFTVITGTIFYYLR